MKQITTLLKRIKRLFCKPTLREHDLPEAIYCKTKKQSRTIRRLMHERGFRWSTGESYIGTQDHRIAVKNVVYFPYEGTWWGGHYRGEVSAQDVIQNSYGPPGLKNNIEEMYERLNKLK